MDSTAHCVTDPDVRCTYDCLEGTAFPHLIGTRIASVTDSQDLFQVVSCLQLTERGVYVTLDHRYIPELKPKGKERQSSGGSEKDESSGQEDAMVVPFDEELAVPGSYIENEGTTGDPTGSGLSNQELARLLLQGEPGRDEDIDDEPITIYTAHVNTEDEDHFFEDDEDVDEVFVDDGHECHSRSFLRINRYIMFNDRNANRCGVGRLFSRVGLEWGRGTKQSKVQETVS